MPKQRKPKTIKVRQTSNGTPLKVVGTSRWRMEVPEHLQDALGKALTYMEANDIGNSLWWFGQAFEQCQSNAEAKPVLYFGGQMAAAGFFAAKANNPNSPHVKEWQQITEELTHAAMEVAPEDAVAVHNYARFLQDIGGRDDEAIQHYRHAMLLDSSQVETWGNLGTIYYQRGEVDKAWELWNGCISKEATKASAAMAQSYIWLRMGEYQKGWAAFNRRWEDLTFAHGYGRQKELGGIHWKGEPLNPKKHSLLLHGEQGLGDHVQFARYVPRLREHGYRIEGLETRGILKRWMEAAFPDLPIFERDKDKFPEFTHHCSTMDLPGILGTTPETVPPPIAPHVWPLPRTAEIHNRHIAGREGQFLVGIAWEGAKGNTADYQRSIPHEALIHLTDIPGVTWVSLQFSEHAALVGRSWLGKNFVDGTEGCKDVLDTAAVMRGLDLIITVDTLTAHLAGTLGIPTYVLHRYCSEWRWGLDAPTAPQWYPSVTNLTVPSPNNWAGLLERVRAELEAKAHA